MLAIGITTVIHFLVFPLGLLGWLVAVALLTFALNFGFWFMATRPRLK